MRVSRKNPPVLQGNELAAWRRIEADWVATKKRPGSHSTAARAIRFLQRVLDHERAAPASPNSLSTTGYSFLYGEMATEIGRASFYGLTRPERRLALVELGYCAFKAVRQRTLNGRLASREWELFAQHSIASGTDTAMRQETLIDVLDSNLTDTFRFGASKGAHPSDWLVPEIKDRLLPLLPTQEHARFPCLPWQEGAIGTATNMSVVNSYCPQLYGVLAGLAPASAWEKRKEMLPLALEFTPNKAVSLGIDLPSDFDAPAPG